MKRSSEITLNLFNIHELLREPFSLTRKRILKYAAEEFIVEEAEALPHKEVITMKIQIASPEVKHKDDIATAIHRHFYYRRKQSEKKYKRFLQYGWRIMLIALGLIAVLYSLTEFATWLVPDNKFVFFIRESFIILGWVALWRPMELLLYDRYPIKREINLYRRLEQSNVQVILPTTSPL